MKQVNHPFLSQIPEVAQLFQKADVIDIKSIEAPVTLREFIAGFAGYRPPLVDGLFRIRNVFARWIGLAADELPQPTHPRPEDVPMTPGEQMLFTVKKAEEDRYWIAGEEDSHLDFVVAIVREPLSETLNRLYVITFVYYNRPVGRFYFAVIAPFHHLLVHLFMRAAVRLTLQQRSPRSQAA